MGHSSRHIGLDCPKWRFTDGQSGIAECLRSGGGSPKLHDRGTATWRVVFGDRQGGGADRGTTWHAHLSPPLNRSCLSTYLTYWVYYVYIVFDSISFQEIGQWNYADLARRGCA